MNEKSFADKLKQGDEIAYKTLYNNYYEGLCSYVFKLCENKKLSEDIVQEMLLNFFKNRKKINISTSVKSYLFTSARNQFLQHLRKNKIKFDELDTLKWEVISRSANSEVEYNEENSQRLHQYIEELPPRCKEIFIKNKLEEIKYKDIAVELNISIKTVENQMSKALAYLRKRANTLLF